MNESENTSGASGAVITIIFLFVLLTFAIFRFGGHSDNSASTESTNGKKISKKEFLQSVDSGNPEDEIYNKYLKKIYLEQTKNGSSTDVGNILDEFQNEIDTRLHVPNSVSNESLPNIVASTIFSKTNYNTSYEKIFSESKAKGLTTEGKILAAQTNGGSELLSLSSYDKETLLRIATEYDILAEKTSQLATPKIYEVRAKNTIENLKQVSYILKELAKESDSTVYKLWINKYLVTMFDIISNRYVQ